MPCLLQTLAARREIDGVGSVLGREAGLVEQNLLCSYEGIGGPHAQALPVGATDRDMGGCGLAVEEPDRSEAGPQRLFVRAEGVEDRGLRLGRRHGLRFRT